MPSSWGRWESLWLLHPAMTGQPHTWAEATPVHTATTFNTQPTVLTSCTSVAHRSVWTRLWRPLSTIYLSHTVHNMFSAYRVSRAVSERLSCDNGGGITSGGVFSALNAVPSWQEEATKGYLAQVAGNNRAQYPRYSTGCGYPGISAPASRISCIRRRWNRHRCRRLHVFSCVGCDNVSGERGAIQGWRQTHRLDQPHTALIGSAIHERRDSR